MIRNNKLLETLYKCVKQNGICNGCFYGDGTTIPDCTMHMMNDILFFFGNPVPDPNARVLSLEEAVEILSDKKTHLAFSEFISSIHVAKPVIRSTSLSGNVFTIHDPTTNETDQFNKSDYYTKFRIWSAKPSDKLRNDTPWVPLYEYQTEDSQQKPTSKTDSILLHVRSMMGDIPKQG